MKLAVVVLGSDGKTRKACAEFADFVKFEEVHDISMVRIETNLKVRDLAWLTWHSEKRKSVTALEFDKWIETIENIEMDVEGGKIVPLESSQPTG